MLNFVGANGFQGKSLIQPQQHVSYKSNGMKTFCSITSSQVMNMFAGILPLKLI